MIAPELAQDGSTLVTTLVAPARGLAEVVQRRRAAVALVVATAAALATAAVVIPRVDFGAEAALRLQGGPGGELTPFQLEEAAATATKIGHIVGYAAALLMPSVNAVLAACFLFLGFKVAGGRPGFRGALAVAAHGMLPVWLGGLLTIPAALVHAPIPPRQVPALLPSSLAALVPSAPPPLAAALAAIELFNLWALWLVASGMARAAGTSRTRALVVTVVLFLAAVAVLRVIPAAAAAAGGPPGRDPR